MLTGNNLETKEAGDWSFRADVTNDGPATHMRLRGMQAPLCQRHPLSSDVSQHLASASVVVEKEEGIVALLFFSWPPVHDPAALKKELLSPSLSGSACLEQGDLIQAGRSNHRTSIGRIN